MSDAVTKPTVDARQAAVGAKRSHVLQKIKSFISHRNLSEDLKDKLLQDKSLSKKRVSLPAKIRSYFTDCNRKKKVTRTDFAFA